MLIDSRFETERKFPPDPRIEITFNPYSYYSRGRDWKNGYAEYLEVAQKLFPNTSSMPSIFTTQIIPSGALAKNALTYYATWANAIEQKQQLNEENNK